MRRFYPVNRRSMLIGITIIGVASVGFLQQPLVAMALDRRHSSVAEGTFDVYNYVMFGLVLGSGLSPLYLALQRDRFRTR